MLQVKFNIGIHLRTRKTNLKQLDTNKLQQKSAKSDCIWTIIPSQLIGFVIFLSKPDKESP